MPDCVRFSIDKLARKWLTCIAEKLGNLQAVAISETTKTIKTKATTQSRPQQPRAQQKDHLS